MDILAARLHHPHTLAVPERDEIPIRRRNRTLSVTADLPGCGGEHVDDPDAGFFTALAGTHAAGKKFGSVPEPGEARSTETEPRRQLQRVRFSRGDDSDVEARRVGIRQVFAVWRDRSREHRRFGRIGGKLPLHDLT